MIPIIEATVFTKGFRRRLAVLSTLVFAAAGASSSFSANEVNVWHDYQFFKIATEEIPKWSMKIQNNGMVVYQCTDIVGCKLHLETRVDGSVPNLEYTCARGAKVAVLVSGALMLPAGCDGALAN